MHTTGWRQYSLPIILYAVLSTLYLFAIPPGESPDEPSHLQCIEQVTYQNRIPIIDPPPQGEVWWSRERIISGLVCAHMPLYYLMTGYTQQIVQTLSGTPAHFEFPPNNPDWVTGASQSMFEHSPKNSFFTTTEPASLFVLRLESMLLGLVSILAAQRLTWRLAPKSRYAPQVAMILVAGWPQFLFMSRAINNDALAISLSVGVLIVLLEYGKPRRYILATVLAVLATLSKLTMFFTIFAVVLTFVLEVIMNRERGKYLRAGLISLLVIVALGALLMFQPTLRSHIQWTEASVGAIQSTDDSAGYWLNVLNLTLLSGWARFGWMNVTVPNWQAYVWWLALAVTSVSSTYAIIRSKNQSTRLALLISFVWIVAVLGVYVRINLNRFQPQFRYSFSMIPALAALAGAGLFVFLGQREHLKRIAAPLLAAVLLVANLWIIFAVVEPTYA